MFLWKLSLLLPHLNYMTFHYLYFILTTLVSSIIFWLSSRPERSINYVDPLFMATSAMTETGLNTVNISQINKFQQVFLFLLMIGGSPVFVSYFVVLVRKRAFELRFSELVQVYEADKKDITHDLGNSLHVLFHSSSHPEEQCETIGVSPRIEARLSSSATTTLHNATSGNGSRRLTVDMLQFTCTRDMSSHHRIPVGGLKDAITSHPENLQEADELRRPGCLALDRMSRVLKFFLWRTIHPPRQSLLHLSFSLPVLIPLRSSNVYEERSLGIYKHDLQTKTSAKVIKDGVKANMRRQGIQTKLIFLRQQLEHQLAHYIWWLTISIVFIV
jgi:hypothetical protein